jgi:DNA mismatch endonuclease (patch repair protein)
VDRDRKQQQELERAGWNVLIIWECETADADQLRTKLAALIGRRSDNPSSVNGRNTRRPRQS